MAGKDSAFISYSHKDRELILPAIRLQEDLKAAAFIDEYSISQGSRWRNEIAKAIERAEVFVLCWSKNAAASTEVEGEWRYALDHLKKIIPVLIDDTSLPDELKHIQALTTLRRLIPHVQTELREIYRTSQRRPRLFIWQSICVVVTVFAIALPFWTVVSKGIGALAPLDLTLLAFSSVLGIVAVNLHRKAMQWSQLTDALNRAVIDEMKTQYGRPVILFTNEDIVGWEVTGRCPYCDAPLRTPKARQCGSCGQAWHGSDVKAVLEWSKDGRIALQASPSHGETDSEKLSNSNWSVGASPRKTGTECVASTQLRKGGEE